MKNFIWTIALLFIGTTLTAQKSIDALFNKYGGKDGFITVTINGNLLKLAAALDDENKSDSSMPKNLTQIRILAQDDESIKVENFYELVIKDIDLNLYEEFMKVKSSDSDVRMLVRTENNRFKEFLLIVGGKDNNALIQIQGDMTLEEARKFADDAKKDNGKSILNGQKK